MPKNIEELKRDGKDLDEIEAEKAEETAKVLEEEAGTPIDKSTIAEVIRATKLAEAEIRKRKRDEKERVYSEPKIIKSEGVGKLSKYMETIMTAFDDHIRGVFHGRYKNAFEKKHSPGIIVELRRVHPMSKDYVEVKRWSQEFHITQARERFEIAIGPIKGCCLQINFQNKSYLVLSPGSGNELALAAQLGIMYADEGTFLNLVIERLSEFFEFRIGEIDITGYDNIIKRCNAILRCDDVRIANRHICLAGPPGTGKSMIAKRLIKDNDNYIAMNINVEGKWEDWIPFFSDVLKVCNRKLLIVIDEIDELGLNRDVNRERVFSLLRLMDGVEDTKNVKFLTTTNRPGDLDFALLRYGRLGPIIWVNEPTPEQKKKIVEYYASKYSFGVDVGRIVSAQDGHTGADIRAAFEECIINGIEGTTENIIKNLKLVKEVTKTSYIG